MSEKKSITVNIPTSKLRISHLIYLNNAKGYYLAKIDLDTKDTLWHIKYFLLCRSIELSFKGYLLYKDTTFSKLRSFNHDLEKLYHEAKLLNEISCIQNDPSVYSELVKANLYYSKKSFEYFEGRELIQFLRGYPKLPNEKKLTIFAYELNQEIDKLINQIKWE